MNNILPHSFLVWGAHVEPQVHVLACDQVQRYVDTMLITSGTLASQHVFGPGVDTVAPALAEPMLMLAEEYTGPHQERVRYLAACIVLGRPFNADPGEGGQKVPRQEPKPRTPGPAGRAQALPVASAAY